MPLLGHMYTELWQILNTITFEDSLFERSLKTYFNAFFVDASETEEGYSYCSGNPPTFTTSYKT